MNNEHDNYWVNEYNSNLIKVAISECNSTDWATVYNYLDDEITRNGGEWSDFPGLESAVSKYCGTDWSVIR